MSQLSKKHPTAYFDELTQRFQRERIAFAQPEGDRLPILLDDRVIGIVMHGGSMRVHGEYIDDPAVSDLYHRSRTTFMHGYTIFEEDYYGKNKRQQSPCRKTKGAVSIQRSGTVFHGVLDKVIRNFVRPGSAAQRLFGNWKEALGWR